MTESRFLKACRGEPVDCTPVWFMRQAGRYMEEYRTLRRKFSLLEICRNPELALEVTLQPIQRFPLDAAIIFADILLPLPGMGVDFDFAAGEGPVIHHPVGSVRDIDRLSVFDVEEELSPVLKAIRMARGELPAKTALIGFAGAPFTLASYMIEGGYSRHFLKTKQLMYEQPEAWQRLMKTISEVTVRYLEAQIRAGADAIQLFDSWVGTLDRDDYRQYVYPHSAEIFSRLVPHNVPTIHFGTGTAGFLDLMKDAGGTVQSIDWRVPLSEAWRRLGTETVLQGNLDPVALLAPQNVLRAKVEAVLQQVPPGGRHIFNLGHGIFPATPPGNVAAVTEWVHEITAEV